MRGRLLLFAICLGAASLALRADAGSCTFDTVGSVAFGSYDVLDPSPVDTTGTFTYSCTLPVSPPSISIGRGSSSSFSPRTLRSGSFVLGYNLFLDASRTLVWGDGTSGTGVHDAAAPAAGQPYTVTIFGRIPARQDVAAGSYGDGVVVTIDF